MKPARRDQPARRRAGLGALGLGVVAAALLVAPAPAQETAPAAEEPAAGAPAAGAPAAADDELEAGDRNLSAIEDLLAQDESVLTDADTFSYDPGLRRDPFRSLIETRDTVSEPHRERPEGKAGLLIDEIVVEGVFELADGPVAQVQSAREETSYLLRPGDQLWDGDVISINLQEVVFKQVVEDPTALKPFREVVKRLSP
ncbi:MAG TPA: hypothetical protein VGG06_24840 [Thermoanaerobaculia bacterium]